MLGQNSKTLFSVSDRIMNQMATSNPCSCNKLISDTVSVYFVHKKTISYERLTSQKVWTNITVNKKDAKVEPCNFCRWNIESACCHFANELCYDCVNLSPEDKTQTAHWVKFTENVHLNPLTWF